MASWPHPARVAAALLLLVFTGHTVGGVLNPPSMGAAGDEVLAAMKAVHFNFMGADATYYGFLFGSGLLASVWYLFSAVVAWELGQTPAPRALRSIAWCLTFAHAVTAALSFAYFFAGPALLGVAVTGLLAFTCTKYYA